MLLAGLNSRKWPNQSQTKHTIRNGKRERGKFLFLCRIQTVYLTISVSMIRKKETKSHHKKLRSDTDIVGELETPQLSVFEDAVQEFESKCQAISNFCCQCCQMAGISIKSSHKNSTLCTTCQANKSNKVDKMKDLPIWFDRNGKVQYSLNKELQSLL